MQWYAETLYEERIVSFYESASQETIKNALLCFEVEEGLKVRNGGLCRSMPSLSAMMGSTT